MYAVLDIETTGGKYNQEAITEIAIYRFDGSQVIDRFVSLINPEKEIQEFVSKLTGITNRMLNNAPKFYQVAKRIIEITQNCVIVAHNTSFDYRVLKLEFARLGYDFNRQTLCTVELSRQLFPQAQSYSLGKFARSLGIPLSNRHRADGDARATLELFKLLLQKDISRQIISQFIKNSSTEITPKLIRILEDLPSECGVFYIYNVKGILIYMGWSKNIQKSVNQYFISEDKQKYLHKVVFELCATELIAQFKWYQQQSNLSNFDKQIKRQKLIYGIFLSENAKGYKQLSVKKIGKSKKVCLLKFISQAEAENTLYELMTDFTLCSKLCGFSQAKKGCYNQSIGKCKGACIGKEPVLDYNDRVVQALKSFAIGGKFILIENGRTQGEKSIVFIQDNQLKGYGFISLYHQLDEKIFKDRLTSIDSTDYTEYLLHKYLRKNKNVKIIEL